MEEIKELGVKVADKEEAFWITIKERAEKEISNSEHEIVINKEIVKLAERKIEENKK